MCVCGHIDNEVTPNPHTHVICHVQVDTNLTMYGANLLEDGDY